MRRLAPLCCLLFVGPVLAALAQQPVPPPLGAPEQKIVDALDQKDGPDPSDMGKGPRGDAKKAKESPRLQKLRTLTYDRRPSAILKAWSKPPADFAKKTNPIDLELATLQKQVTLGQWDAVQEYLAKLTREEGKAAYKQMVRSLSSNPPMGPGGPMPMQMMDDMDGPMGPGAMMGGMGPAGMDEMELMMMQREGIHPAMMQYVEKNKFTADDVVALATIAPHGLEKDQINQLGNIIKQSVSSGTVIEHIVGRLQKETARPDGKPAFTGLQAAAALLAGGYGAEAGTFLPPLDKALASRDHDALNLLSRHYLALHAKDKKPIQLEQAWSAVQAVLSAPKQPITGVLANNNPWSAVQAIVSVAKAQRDAKEEAMKRAVELAPKIREELGQTWLEQSFTKDAQRGMDILATLGTSTSQGILQQSRNKVGRFKTLELQKTAVEALLKAAGNKTADWRGTLTLLAGSWLKEAELCYQFDRSSSFGPRMMRDRYGNMFYTGDDDMDEDPRMMMQQQGLAQPISVANVLSVRPSDKWIAEIDEGIRPKLAMLFAQLYLKVGEEGKAFPYIEQLSTTHPDKGRDLVKEFLKVWTKNHNPNASKDYTNPYMFMYGFERRAESIPLTRAKQERNLGELSEWVVKLRGLKLGEFDEELLAKAFTSCHSTAEVYRTEAIEKVFGPIGQLKPNTLAGLAQQMRENLGGLWRAPAEQTDKKTNRKLKDIQAEVNRGYILAQTVIDDGLKKFPGNWPLTLAKASLLHDENNFQNEIAKSSEFSKRRQQALTTYAAAAQQYADQVKTLPEDEHSTKVFEHWLFASLGAADLKQVTPNMVADMRQPALIRKAIQALPGETAKKHMDKFANLLFTRLSAVNPAVKFRYLKAGFEIVGDHPLAQEARKVYDYYKDLITEIKLETAIDGSDAVGNNQPFGVFVNLKHTREIERESGGFGKYLQNQNSGRYSFYYNYGRPTADYRDKFTTTVQDALKEHFEVLSITFQTDKVNSRALPEYGWRYTPYAYLLLKARGPQVDKLPPLRIDLDFLDTSGYVIIPIESAVVPLDAAAKPGGRPYHKLQITQTLDERQADKGKLLVEIKATALGLIPDLDQLVKLGPDGFDVEKVNDHGVSVARFDPDSEQNAIVSERIWTVSLAARPGQAAPETFSFGKAVDANAALTYQRFKDSDLVKVDEKLSLEEQYGKASTAWIWWLAGAGVLVVLIGVTAIFLYRRRPRKQEERLNLPEHLSPFTVLSLLKRIHNNNGLNQSHRQELEQSIMHLERRYFADQTNGEVDLRALAESWVRRTR